jgi:hypothetical protein
MLPRLNGTSRLDKLGRVDMLCPTSKCRFVPFPSKIVDTALGAAAPMKLLLSRLQLHWRPRLRSGLRRLKRRHGLTRRVGNRPWRIS